MKKYIIASIPLIGSFIILGAMSSFKTSTTMTQSGVPSAFVSKLEDTVKSNSSGVQKNVEFEKSSPQFWMNLTMAYNWLKSQNHMDRYVFLFNLSEVLATRNINERHNGMKSWILYESNRIRSSLRSPEQIVKWNRHVSILMESLNDLIVSEKNQAKLTSNLLKQNQQMIESLGGILREASAIKPVERTIESFNTNLISIFILLSGIAGSLVAVFFMTNSDKQVVQPPAPVLNLEKSSNQDPAIDLEELCSQKISDLKFLFSNAGVSIHKTLHPPLPFRINGDRSCLASAVESVIKGTLSVAQNDLNSSDLSFQWSCQSTDERAIFEIDILGKSFTEEEMRRDHALNTGASMISQFARAQKHLASYRPAIKVIPKDNKTKISLSLSLSN